MTSTIDKAKLFLETRESIDQGGPYIDPAKLSLFFRLSKSDAPDLVRKLLEAVELLEMCSVALGEVRGYDVAQFKVNEFLMGLK